MQKSRRRGTLASIAAELGVSRTTVSNAYNRPDQLSDQLRERILETAHRLGYPGPDPMARGLRMRRVGAIGVLFTEHLPFAFDDRASVDFLAGLAESLGETGDSMLVIPASSQPVAQSEESTAQDTQETASHDANLIRQAVVDGFVVYSVADDDPFLATVRERALPTVICDQPTTIDDLPFVGIDDRNAIKPAVEHLLELGHRKVGILSVRLARTPNDGPVSAERLANAHHHVQKNRVEGALETLAEVGIEQSEVPVIERHLNDRDNNLAAAQELLENYPDLTAVICTTDTQALAVLQYASEKGIRVPEDLSVTGFDGIELAMQVGLTTVVQPTREKGRAVGRVLAEESERREAAAGSVATAETAAGSTGESGIPRIILETSFEAGRTTAQPRETAAK